MSEIIDELAKRAYQVFLNQTPKWSVFNAHGHGGELRWQDLAPAEKEIFRAMTRHVITGSVRYAKAHKEGRHHGTRG